MVTFLMTIDNIQILKINKEFHGKEDGRISKYSKITLDELYNDILKRTYKFLENWLGNLEPSKKSKNR